MLTKGHVRVEIIENIIPPHIFRYMCMFVDLVWCIFNLVIAYEAYIFAVDSLGTVSPVLEWDMGYVYMNYSYNVFLNGRARCGNLIEETFGISFTAKENQA